jgi:hypothetical protein
MNLSHWITAQIISFFVDLELKAKWECKLTCLVLSVSVKTDEKTGKV